MSAAVGNQYAAKDRVWRSAILRALENRSRVDQKEALDAIAERLVSLCMGGEDLQALKELGDRLDGKPKQQIDMGGIDGEPIRNSMTVEFVGPIPGKA